MEQFWFDPRFSAIAITGGPCGGKSTFMARARELLEASGFRTAVQPEVATELIMSGFSPVSGWRDDLKFQKNLISYMIHREEMYYKMLLDQDTDKPLVLLCDRGVLDSIAYIGTVNFESIATTLGYEMQHLRERYKAVVHLVTAASGAEEHYITTNNTARHETPAEARTLDSKTMDAWMGHPHLIVIDNSTNFEEKMDRAFHSLSRVIPMPTAVEKERKFVVLKGSPPDGATSVEIIQDYLLSRDLGVERRVRIRFDNYDSPTYFYTEKWSRPLDDERNEMEEQITLERYQELLSEKDPSCQTVKKTRWTFVHNHHRIEHDLYNSIIPDQEMAEVEGCRRDEVVTFPPGYVVKEVTGDKRFSNRSIAQGNFPLEEVRNMVA